jgi:predicted metal-dependent enzyme (double-stranded beta helix superfamily)
MKAGDEEGGMGIDELVRRLSASTREAGPGPQDAVAALEEALGAGADWLEPRYRRIPDGEDSALYPLYRDPEGRFSVIAAVFRPGFPTTVHDHGTWAVIGVLSGVERETCFRRPGDGAATGAGLAEYRIVESSPGSVRVLPEGTIHAVEALGEAEAVSVHVYGADIIGHHRSAFDPTTGEERPYDPPPTEPSQTPD